MIAAAWLIAGLYAFWLLFLAVMALKACWRRLPLPTRIIAAPAALAAVVIDVAFNLTIATLLLADWPREATFSQRLGRYQTDGAGWRLALATWICANLLDPFDAGGHCRRRS